MMQEKFIVTIQGRRWCPNLEICPNTAQEGRFPTFARDQRACSKILLRGYAQVQARMYSEGAGVSYPPDKNSFIKSPSLSFLSAGLPNLLHPRNLKEE